MWTVMYEEDDPSFINDYTSDGSPEKCLIEVERGEKLLAVVKKIYPFHFHCLFHPRNYYLTLDRDDGLMQRVDSTSTIIKKDAEYTGHRLHKPVGRAGLKDYEVIGSYALERFPNIAAEITNPLSARMGEIPEEFHEDMKKARNESIDWKSFEKDVCGAFHKLFCSSLEQASLKKNDWIRLRKLIEPLSNL